MNQELGFETIPFEIAPEFQGELFEEEGELRGRRSFAGGGSRYSRPRSGSGRRSRGATRPPTARRRPPPKWRRGPWAVVHEPYSIVKEPYLGQPEPSGSERARWVQDCLNQAMGLQLPVTGVMGPETRSAVRSFQKQERLRVSGIVGPDTEEALKTACKGHVVHTMGSGRGIGPTAEEISGTLSNAPTGDLLEEEYPIRKSYAVTLRGLEPVVLKNAADVARLSRSSGIYFIYDRATMRYVGKSTGIRARFRDRNKTFRDYGIPEDTYFGWLRSNGINIRSYEVIDSTTGRAVVDNPMLGALEEYFIKMHGTRSPAHGRNRDRPRPVVFSKGARIDVRYEGPRHHRNHQNIRLTVI